MPILRAFLALSMSGDNQMTILSLWIVLNNINCFVHQNDTEAVNAKCQGTRYFAFTALLLLPEQGSA